MTSVTYQAAEQKAPTSVATKGKTPKRLLLLLGFLLLTALVVRLDDLTTRTFGHPENFVTGLNVPEWVNYPPPRHDLEGIYRGTLIDGHPPGYFVVMLPWVKTFGSSLLALRLPSVILGALSVLLLFYLARRETDDGTALLAAALLAFNGHHVFWSQQARMYAMASLLGLTSCLLLWKLLETGRRSYSAAYFLVAAAMLWTQLYCWPLLIAQMAWATLHSIRNGVFPVALKAQVAAVMAASPVVQLSIYQNPPTQWKQSALEYFGFGYLYYSESLFFGATHPLARLSVPLSILGLALVLLAWRVRSLASPVMFADDRRRRSAFSFEMLIIALLATAIMVWFPLTAPAASTGRLTLLALAAIPLVLMTGLALTFRMWSRLSDSLARRRLVQMLPRSQFIWLALLPWAMMYAVSVARPSFVARGALIFVPYLLVVFAIAIRSITRVTVVRVAALGLLLVLHVGSLVYFSHVESSGRDYQGLALQLRNQLQPNDVILVRNRFSHPPLLYYLPEQLDQVVPLEAARNNGVDPGRRVWVVDLEEPADSNLYSLVSDRVRGGAVEAYGGRAVLFMPKAD